MISGPGYDSLRRTPQPWRIANDCDCACDSVLPSKVVAHSAWHDCSPFGFDVFSGPEAKMKTRKTIVTYRGGGSGVFTYSNGTYTWSLSASGSYSVIEEYIHGFLYVTSVSGSVEISESRTDTRPGEPSWSGIITLTPEVAPDGRSWSLKTDTVGGGTPSLPNSGALTDTTDDADLERIKVFGYSGSNTIPEGSSQWDWSIETKFELSEEFTLSDAVSEVDGALAKITVPLEGSVTIEYLPGPLTDSYIDGKVSTYAAQADDVDDLILQEEEGLSDLQTELSELENALSDAMIARESSYVTFCIAEEAYAGARRTVETLTRRSTTDPSLESALEAAKDAAELAGAAKDEAEYEYAMDKSEVGWTELLIEQKNASISKAKIRIMEHRDFKAEMLFMRDIWMGNKTTAKEAIPWIIDHAQSVDKAGRTSDPDSKKASAGILRYKIRAGLKDWASAPTGGVNLDIAWAEVSSGGTYSSVPKSDQVILSSGSAAADTSYRSIAAPSANGEIVVAGPGNQIPKMKMNIESRGATMHKFGFYGYSKNNAEPPTVYRTETSTGAHSWFHGFEEGFDYYYYDSDVPDDYRAKSFNISTPAMPSWGIRETGSTPWLDFSGPGIDVITSEASRTITHEGGSIQTITLSNPISTSEIISIVEAYVDASSEDWDFWRIKPEDGVAINYLSSCETCFSLAKTEIDITLTSDSGNPMIYFGESWTTNGSVTRVSVNLRTSEATEEEVTKAITWNPPNITEWLISEPPPEEGRMVYYNQGVTCDPVARLHLLHPIVTAS